MREVDLRGAVTASRVNAAIPRALVDIAAATEQVTPIIVDVEKNGVNALVALAKKFDGVDPSPIRVTAAELRRALEDLDPQLRVSIEESISRVRMVSSASMPTGNDVNVADGAVVSLRWQPVDSVGLYVPGGKAVYPSSVVMNVVPAQVAGVKRLALASPAQAAFGGRPHPTILATAALLGVEEVYSMGGPGAIAALAIGVSELGLEPVDVITGPGNIYVAAAKRALKGRVGIDSEAGTTEILIIADDSADPYLVAHDLVSQAEHDEAAAAVLVTASQQLMDAVAEKVALVAAKTQHRERVATALSGQQSALVLVDDLDAAISVANHYAAEHLEIVTQNAELDAEKITNAGAIFLGSYSPVSLGDYMAGSNHVLPTGGQARHASGLGVHTFLKPQQIVNYGKTALEDISNKIDTFAIAEGLNAHGDAVRARFE
jgi:histidinol dehydrogenase